MKSTAKILIIIVTWNKKEYVIDLLDSISTLNFPRDQLDILVIDNASNDGTVEALEAQFDDIQIIRNSENIGGTGGFNTGLAWAFEQPDSRYDYLWLLDNDVVVHQNALSELVAILDKNADIAIAGSTMMQLDYPWRINEMGAFVDQQNGTLLFNRHFEEIPNWRGQPVEDLLTTNADLSQQLMHCQSQMDVDYVAAASLLIRAPVAKQAGLWMDFFIHFDDVEWCLRIGKTGHRIVVSAKSLIWHLSAAAKVPNWILYYDNRNILYLLDKYSDKTAVTNTLRRTLKKALYYQLIGKPDLTDLHVQAVRDYKQGIKGKKAIQLPHKFEKITEIGRILNDPAIKKVLVPWTINMQANNIQSIFVRAMNVRPELEVFYIDSPHGSQRQLPKSNTTKIAIPLRFVPRYLKYYRMRNQFDLALQSDYHVIKPLSWIAPKNLFINDEDFCLRPAQKRSELFELLPVLFKEWFQKSK
ncbi:MAG: glycosyltransferase family 2 protein [Methyloprofundus sp.]|nr:glycosyltransferase family 2 protein [Methyloprofundus sp.]